MIVPTPGPVPLMGAPQIQAPIRVAQPSYGKLNFYYSINDAFINETDKI
jgi:hypothetical protein